MTPPKEKTGHGGRRPGAGRKPRYGARAEQVSTNLPPEVVTAFKAHAAENKRSLSAEIAERLMRSYRALRRDETMISVQSPSSLLDDEFHDTSGKLVVFTYEDSNMEPTIRRGDKVVVDRREFAPYRPGIYATWLYGEIVINRIDHTEDGDPGKLRISSDNKQYKPYDCPIEDIAFIGRVVARYVQL